MQVYRGMDIGTAKPPPEDQDRVPHAMIDLVDPEVEYSVARFQTEARRAIDDWPGVVLIVGGSGLHFRAIVDPLVFPPNDPELRRQLEAEDLSQLQSELETADSQAGVLVDFRNRRRVERAVEILRLTRLTPTARSLTAEATMVAGYQPLLAFTSAGVDPGPGLAGLVTARLEAMRAGGLVAEVSSLRGRLGRTAIQAVGYRQLIPVISGEITEETGFANAAMATQQLARRQRTFFKRDPRITWVGWQPDPERLVDAIMAVYREG